MLSLIAAVARNRGIGKNQQLLWRLPEDMLYFKEKTLGKPVIMGRRTWESLPTAFRPLPGRTNIVVSTNVLLPASGATLAGSIEQALALAGEAAETVVIGGAEIYRQTLPLAERLYLTEVAADCEADVFFPEISPDEWREISRRAGQAATNSPAYDFVIYDRQPRAASTTRQTIAIQSR
ncbi:MAG TPA: dihydrofolate reductase [Accumulibacter sp.]|nr:dihydrofolate reductase [Accumulibacter sp.]HPP46404.1 dihydrofolate reductase [Accumulibacter sp.]